MAQLKQHTPVEEVLELLNQQGSQALGDALAILLNAAMLLERQRFLNAEPYEHTPARRDYANGFKPKQLYGEVLSFLAYS